MNSHAPPPVSHYSPAEELANGLTHAIAVLLSISGLVLMLFFSIRNGNVWHITSSAIYGSTLILLYLSSTFYHLLPWPHLKRLFQKLDHAMIYLLIAGTYTPYTLVNLHGPWGWTLFGLVWGFGLAGMTVELLVSKPIPRLSLTIYLGLGWLMIIAIKPLLHNLETGGVLLLVAGGLSYSLGVLFYVRKTMAFHHMIWHLFVMAGSLLHFFSIFFYVIP